MKFSISYPLGTQLLWASMRIKGRLLSRISTAERCPGQELSNFATVEHFDFVPQNG